MKVLLEDEITGMPQVFVRKRKSRFSAVIPKVEISELVEVAGVTHAFVPLLTLNIISTVLSFVSSMPCVRSWVSDNMRTKLSKSPSVMNTVSMSQGFALIMFALKNNKKEILATPPGQLWQFVLSRALQEVVTTAKTSRYRPRRRRIPPPDPSSGEVTTEAGSSDSRPAELEWLSMFKVATEIEVAVRDSMRTFGGVSREAASASSGTETQD